MKQFFSNLKERFKNLRITGFFKNIITKAKDNKTAQTVAETAKETTNKSSDFFKSHDTVKDGMAGNIMSRIQKVIHKMQKKLRKNRKKNDQEKKPGVMKKAFRLIKRIVCILLALAFAAFVVFAIKDVFLYCLQLVALCAAVVIVIEFILWVLGNAIGCEI